MRANSILRNALAPVVQAKKSKLLGQLDQELGDFKSLHQHLMAAIVENPPVLLRDGNVIAEGYDAELDELRQIRDHAGQFLIDLEIKERERTGISTLKIGYNRVSGYYIELTRARRASSCRLYPPSNIKECRALHYA